MKFCRLVTICIFVTVEVCAGVASSLRHNVGASSHLRTSGHVARNAGASQDLHTLRHGARNVGASKDLRKRVHGIVEESEETLDKIMNVDVPSMAVEGYDETRAVLLPRLTISLRSIFVSLALFLVAVMWFFMFFTCIYQNDREEIKSGRWSKYLENAESVDDIDLSVQGDIMFVFHHPDYEYDDRSSKASADKFEQILVLDDVSSDNPDGRSCKYLQRTSELRKRAVRTSGSWWTSRTSDTSQSDEPTIGEVRVALLQDLYQDLFGLGFSVTVFSSCDEDEIFLSVKLSKPETIRKYLDHQEYPLRINRELIPKLGIGQSPDVPTPMLRYDPKTIEGLHRAKVIESPDEREVYRTHTYITDDERKDKIVSRSDRIRLIFTMLSKFIDLDAAVSSGFLLHWYPVHTAHHIPHLKASWGNPWLLLDLSFVQPIISLKTYFGPRVAFIFAWNGFYSKALLALSPIALIAVAVGYFAHQSSYTSGSHMVVLVFSTIIIVWARIAYNLWEREEGYFLQVWDLASAVSDFKHLTRPTFHGEYMQDIRDSNKIEKQYPDNLLTLRKFATFFVTLFFCSLVIAFIVVWYEIFQGTLTFVSGTLLVIEMKLFEVMWDALTPVLTEFENHKYQASYVDSFVWKNFAFQAVNLWGEFFYLAIRLQNREDCEGGDCLYMLQQLLIAVHLFMLLEKMVTLIASSYWVKFKLWHEVYQYKKTHNGEEPPDRPRAEEEAKMSAFRTEDQIVNTCQLMLSIGFIILFGGTVPIMVPFSLLHVAVNLRMNAQVLLSSARRPFPRRQRGIGAWKDIMLLVMRIAVLFSGYLMVMHSDFFTSAPAVTRLTGLVIYCVLMFVTWGIVDCLMPTTTKDAVNLTLQNKYVLQEIRRKSRVKASDQKRAALRRQVSELAIQQEGTSEEYNIPTHASRKGSFEESPVSRAAWSEIRPLEYHRRTS